MSSSRLHRVLFLRLLFILIATGCTAAQTAASAVRAPVSSRARVIVFVHGLHGDHESWRAANGAYWPDMVKSDPHFAFSDVDVAQYPSPASKGTMSSVQLAETLWTNLKQDHVWDHREVVFVAHSLGGILVEQMLLRHPAEAQKIKFIVSYGTPHEGSTVARIAALYDKDPLLNDLSDAGSNTFLTQLEDSWRRHASVNGIHRFCAYETEDTRPQEGVARYLRTHTRVVSYFSATYGCDVTTPPQEIHEDHIHMIKPLNRSSAAYDFFRRVYRDNPILEDHVVNREAALVGLNAGCNQTNENPDLQIPVALDGTLQERIVAATASLINTVDVRAANPNPPVVTAIDTNGVIHVRYGFQGPSKKLLVCLGTAHASLLVQYTVDQQVPLREPQQ